MGRWTPFPPRTDVSAATMSRVGGPVTSRISSPALLQAWAHAQAVEASARRLRPDAPPRKDGPARITGFFGVGGKGGATFVTTMTGVVMVGEARTLCIDADWPDAMPRDRQPLEDLVRLPRRATHHALMREVVRDGSGLGILPLVDRWRPTLATPARALARILEILSADAEHLLIDLGDMLDPWRLTCLPLLDDMILVTRPEALLTGAAHEARNALVAAGANRSKMQLVVNGLPRGPGFVADHVRDIIGAPVLAVLPDDTEDAEALWQGGESGLPDGPGTLLGALHAIRTALRQPREDAGVDDDA